MAARGYTGLGGQYSGWVPEIAGPQMPQKYPRVGKNYQTFGEQEGYVYYPLQDKYIPDPKYQKKFAEDNGFTEKKKGLQEMLLPIAATGATVAATQGLFTNPTEFVGNLAGGVGKLGDKVGGLFGLGGSGASGVGPVADGATYAGSIAPEAVTGGSSILPSFGGLTGLSSVAVPGAVIGATALGGKAAYDMLRGKEPGLPGRVTLGIATGGLSELGKALGLFGHKSTKQYQKERWGALGDNPIAKTAYEANHGGDNVWDSGKYAGQEWSYDKALDLAKSDPSHFQLVLGNMQLGDKFSSLSDAQQKAFTKQMVDANNYNNSKGDILLKDRTLAEQVLGDITSGKIAPYTAPPPAASSGTPLDKSQGLTGLLKSGDRMANGKTYISPGVYR